MNFSQLIYKIDDIESSSRLLEGLNYSERKSALLWESAGRSLREAQLNPQQITQLFQDIEKSLTDAGSNRTGLGQGKDVAVAVNQAWQDLKAKVGSSGPIKNIDAMYDQAAEKLKQATGGDTDVMQYIQKYRDFAKKHPIAQSLIYSVLIAAAGISGAGVGGAAALGLLKMTDKLLQGEKFSSAAYAGAKTGGLAYAAGQVGKTVQGRDTVNASDVTPSGANNFVKIPGMPQATITPEQMTQLQKLSASGSKFFPKGGDLWYSTPDGPAFIDTKGLSVSPEQLMKIVQSGATDATVNESVNLSEHKIATLFVLVETRLLDEGVLDGIKKTAGAVSNWASTKRHNLTTKVTADKLQSAWKQAGSPTDSEQVKQILTNAGVDAGIVDKAFADMGIAKAPVTPSQTVNIDDIVARIKKLAPADQQRVLAFLQAK
jgi:hypothetical protein